MKKFSFFLDQMKKFNFSFDQIYFFIGFFHLFRVYKLKKKTTKKFFFFKILLKIKMLKIFRLFFCSSPNSGLTAISTYLLTKELWSPGAGLFAASFIAIVPGYISRSVAGSYDNEGIAIFALQFTYYLWVKSVKTGSVFWAAMAALSYFYMVSAWGGYVFIINLIPLHVFVLLLMGRYSPRLFTSYTTFYILGLLFSMQIPFVGFQPIRTSEHMAASGVFALIMAVALLKHMQTILSKQEFKKLFIIGALAAAALVFGVVVLLTLCGVSLTLFFKRNFLQKNTKKKENENVFFLFTHSGRCTMERSILFTLGHWLR